MSRTSSDEIINGITKNGYDYQLQCWIRDYIVQPCGHPKQLRGCTSCHYGEWNVHEVYWDKYSDHAMIEMGVYNEVHAYLKERGEI